MFFFVSKLFWAVAQPLTFIALCFLTGLAFYKKQCGRRLVVISAILFVLCGFLPVGPVLIRYLEAQAPMPQSLPAHIDGIIVLGGAVNAESSAARNQPQLNEWSERIFEMMRLSRTYPQARVIYTGGAGSLREQHFKESDIVRKMLTDLQFPIKNFIFEDSSRTTFENVNNSKTLVSPQAGENWLLVTSAFHMRRSLAVFEKQGWKVIPYPAGYIENDAIEPWQFVDVPGNYWKLNVAVKEILGIIAYKFSGRI